MSSKVRNMKTYRFLVPLLLSVLGAVVAGCGVPVGVQRVGVEQAYHEINANVLNQGVLSTASVEVLQRRDLKGRFDEAPTEVLERLHKEACQDNSRKLLFALRSDDDFAGVETYPDGHGGALRPLYLISITALACQVSFRWL